MIPKSNNLSDFRGKLPPFGGGINNKEKWYWIQYSGNRVNDISLRVGETETSTNVQNLSNKVTLRGIRMIILLTIKVVLETL